MIHLEISMNLHALDLPDSKNHSLRTLKKRSVLEGRNLVYGLNTNTIDTQEMPDEIHQRFASQALTPTRSQHANLATSLSLGFASFRIPHAQDFRDDYPIIV
ncbi:hypothetical protein AVEN_232463-1 [Araneus ventricosus]|uniref:Uncharacterized protein n=1 Tax=Araneus ventricosus TaxID=182803 RepID=A0A4Y2EAF2_ARAVE|nr:hypothetical protein AVEN_232463-1 [Araneus ventricosus]